MNHIKQSLKYIPFSRKKEILMELAVEDKKRTDPERMHKSIICSASKGYCPNMFGRVAIESGNFGFEAALENFLKDEQSVDTGILQMVHIQQRFEKHAEKLNYLEIELEAILEEAKLHKQLKDFTKNYLLEALKDYL